MPSPRPRISVTQTQRLALNIGLQTSIGILRMDASGLTRYLEEQAADNPYLRLDPPPPPGPGDWLPRWAMLFGSGAAPGRADVEPEAPPASLMAHVAAELDRLYRGGRDRQIAQALADALEPSGWLGRDLMAIAAETGAAVSDVEAVLQQLQRMDPAGLFARNLAECLRLQLAEAGCLDPVMAGLLEHLDVLAAGDLARLARLCRTTEPEIAARFRTIRTLDPKPGARFAVLALPPLREPDLVARHTAAGGWEIALNRSSLPALQFVSGDGRAKSAAAPSDDGGDRSSRRAGARALLRMVQARNATLLRVGAEILRVQVAALHHGPGALVPMTMADVAQALGLHDSTVSRVVAGASVDTPRGAWWLRHLFSTRLGGADGDGPSGAALRHRLARLIAQEPADAPLSDAALVLKLAESGADLARRTVAKYREQMHIPPAHRRKRRTGL